MSRGCPRETRVRKNRCVHPARRRLGEGEGGTAETPKGQRPVVAPVGSGNCLAAARELALQVRTTETRSARQRSMMCICVCRVYFEGDTCSSSAPNMPEPCTPLLGDADAAAHDDCRAGPARWEPEGPRRWARVWPPSTWEPPTWDGPPRGPIIASSEPATDLEPMQGSRDSPTPPIPRLRPTRSLHRHLTDEKPPSTQGRRAPRSGYSRGITPLGECSAISYEARERKSVSCSRYTFSSCPPPPRLLQPAHLIRSFPMQQQRPWRTPNP